jgi:ATP-dependent Zn protease
MKVPASPPPGGNRTPRKGKRRRRGQRSRAKRERLPAGQLPSPPRCPERSPELLYRIAVHEAGHAVVRHQLQMGILERITIDGPEGGSVRWIMDVQGEPLEFMLELELWTLLTGRAAEEMILGDCAVHRDGGRDSALAAANDIAFRMETVLGFGRKWPLLYRPATDRAALYAIDPDLAEHVHGRLRKAYAGAQSLVRTQEEAIRYLADVLMNYRTLEGPTLAIALEEVERRAVKWLGK